MLLMHVVSLVFSERCSLRIIQLKSQSNTPERAIQNKAYLFHVPEKATHTQDFQ